MKNGKFPPSWESAGLWFQVVDQKGKDTVVAGAMAPYSAGGKSIIGIMNPEGALEADEKCTGEALNDDDSWVPEHDGL